MNAKMIPSIPRTSNKIWDSTEVIHDTSHQHPPMRYGLQKTPENAHPIALRSSNVNCYNSPPDSVPLLPEQSASTRNRIVSSESIPRPPLWSSGQSFWPQIQGSRVRSPALPDFLSSSGSGTGSTQPREVNWGATWMKKVAAPDLENRD